MVVAGDTTAVLGRTMAFAAHADGVRQSRFRGQNFLNGDAVLPAITEVIGVHRFGADLAKYVEQPRRALVADGRKTCKPVVGSWFPEPPWTNAEVMHVTVLPLHGQLQHVVQLLQGHVRGHQQAAPDRRGGAEQGDFELIDFLRNLDLLRRHARPSLSECGAPRRLRGGGASGLADPVAVKPWPVCWPCLPSLSGRSGANGFAPDWPVAPALGSFPRGHHQAKDRR